MDILLFLLTDPSVYWRHIVWGYIDLCEKQSAPFLSLLSAVCLPSMASQMSSLLPRILPPAVSRSPSSYTNGASNLASVLRLNIPNICCDKSVSRPLKLVPLKIVMISRIRYAFMKVSRIVADALLERIPFSSYYVKMMLLACKR